MKHVSWKYIAGLIDGEGCLDFQVGRSRYTRQDGSQAEYSYITPRLRLTLVESCNFLLELLKNQAGGSISYENRANENPNWQNVSTWQLENARLRPVLQYTIPFLYVKKEQARLLLWIIDNMRGRTVKQSGMSNLDAARQVAREQLKVMKRDPQRLSEVAVRMVEEALTDAIVQAA